MLSDNREREAKATVDTLMVSGYAICFSTKDRLAVCFSVFQTATSNDRWRWKLPYAHHEVALKSKICIRTYVRISKIARLRIPGSFETFDSVVCR